MSRSIIDDNSNSFNSTLSRIEQAKKATYSCSTRFYGILDVFSAEIERNHIFLNNLPTYCNLWQVDHNEAVRRKIVSSWNVSVKTVYQMSMDCIARFGVSVEKALTTEKWIMALLSYAWSTPFKLL